MSASSLMTIGDFSRAVRLSAKTLRFYHRNDILTPAVVDESNGYRLYAAEQIADAQVVRALRALQLPVHSIREILSAPDVAARSAMLAQHLDQMEARLEQTQSAVTRLRDLLSGSAPTIEVSYRSVPETPIVAITEVIDATELGEWFRRSMRQLKVIADRSRPESIGTYGGIWPNQLVADGRGQATVFLTIRDGFDETVVDGAAARASLAAAEVAVAVHRGPDDDVPRVYAALGAHVARHELATEAPAREIYLDGLPGIDPLTVTEVQWPIFRATR